MRKDLVLCALWRDFLNFFFIFRILGQNQEKVSFLVDLRCSKVTKPSLYWIEGVVKNLHILALLSIWLKYNDTFTNMLMLFKLQNDQKLIHLEEKEVNLLIW